MVHWFTLISEYSTSQHSSSGLNTVLYILQFSSLFIVYLARIPIVYQFLFLQSKIAWNLIVWNNLPNICFWKLKSCLSYTPAKKPYVWDQWGRPPMTRKNHGHAPAIYWWTSHFADVFLPPGVNSRAELVPWRRWLEYNFQLHNFRFVWNLIFQWPQSIIMIKFCF
jgi:hypothetical protein